MIPCACTCYPLSLFFSWSDMIESQILSFLRHFSFLNTWSYFLMIILLKIWKTCTLLNWFHMILFISFCFILYPCILCHLSCMINFLYFLENYSIGWYGFYFTWTCINSRILLQFVIGIPFSDSRPFFW
jgi:hypothetical protein